MFGTTAPRDPKEWTMLRAKRWFHEKSWQMDAAVGLKGQGRGCHFRASDDSGQREVTFKIGNTDLLAPLGECS